MVFPWEEHLLLERGYGITNLVARATARADELSVDELRAGGERLRGLVASTQPRWVAVVGIGAYRLAFERPRATFGRQPERMHASGLWVLPNPSGLNANHQLADLAAEFRKLRVAGERAGGGEARSAQRF
jgi:TDG/mug DNA glycosylase family protein